jgi:histidinol dehydrogenase
MRIFALTKARAARLLTARRSTDRAAERVAARIVADVRRRGDVALFAWTRRLDRLSLGPNNLWVSPAEIAQATRRVDKKFLEALAHAARNIRAVAHCQLPKEWTIHTESGVQVGQLVRPIHRIGCYIPGGRHSLVSTLLMTVIPAQIAGVREIVVTSPQPGDSLLAAAGYLGVRHVARIGGAQAIAALAYGTRSVARVDKIFGPGNRYVAAAKRLVSMDCAIDLLAGPTEAIVLSNDGDPRFIAADLLAQAEHDPDATALLLTTSAKLGKSVVAEIQRQLAPLPRSNPAWRSLANRGAVLVASDIRDAIQFVNAFAPEHLTLAGSAGKFLDRIDSAASIFVGDASAQSFGDYMSGTNHTLPTNGVARTRGGLSASDFVKCLSVQEVTARGFAAMAAATQELARAEGLLAHGLSIEVRK